MEYTREEAEAVVEWANAEEGTARYVAAEDQLSAVEGMTPGRALALFEHLVDSGTIVSVCREHSPRR